jgi:hypothetical protein
MTSQTSLRAAPRRVAALTWNPMQPSQRVAMPMENAISFLVLGSSAPGAVAARASLANPL